MTIRRFAEPATQKQGFEMGGENAEGPVDDRSGAEELVEPAGGEGGKFDRLPVRSEERERFGENLPVIRERQEIAAAIAIGIQSGSRKALGKKDGSQKKGFTGMLDIERLEDLIFIGREKG